MVENILSVQNLGKVYKGGGRELTVLEKINFSVEAGSTISIVGPSGSGKTTLLGLCAGLDQSSTGTVELNHIKLDKLGEDERALVRNRFKVSKILRQTCFFKIGAGAIKSFFCK